MREIIHIELVEEYPDFRFKDIRNMLAKHFKRINDDTFELKKGIFLKFNKNELLIYEEKEESGNQK